LRKTFELLRSMQRKNSDVHSIGSAEVFQMLMYHTVGGATGPNTRALFTGQRTEFNTSAIHGPYVPLWSYAKSRGWRTLLASTFCEQWEPGYYGRASSFDVEFVAQACIPPYAVEGNIWSIFSGANSPVVTCTGGRYQHEIVFEGVRQFWNASAGGKFAVASLMEAHEMFGNRISVVDEHLAQLISDFSARQDTAIFLVSDHGSHMNLPWLLNLEQGLLENVLPLFVGIIPHSMFPHGDESLARLRREAKLLNTPHRAWATIAHLLDHVGAPRVNCVRLITPQEGSYALLSELEKSGFPTSWLSNRQDTAPRSCESELIPNSSCHLKC